jgi:hypothetical protein
MPTRGKGVVGVATLTLPVTDEGIVIPVAAAQLLGYRAGDWVQVEVAGLPSTEELKDKALYYILHHLGDAVYVDDPVWADGAWMLPLRVKGRSGTFGQLFLSPEGEVLVERSTSPMELEEALDAADSAAPPAG